ncbi:helix-turn-helix domain-containing protein [Alicyclobacillus fastidiosus]|uniref:Helix-turn-helix transcriptional regulator n=1 Tax=Alicyclobacillus fastidiosus TaxID=392011 RepID=A0ABV5AK78_9BACL|nr:helix-turn-helix transcriptional regulator [Alicyclobacillus fastidiosus]WEH09311.1 helix-turn-helix transcriptional regulator [Alicyclobacillus fastidiosus]
MTPVHTKVEQVRKQKGVTKVHIAKYCGRSPSWYQDISTGRRKMSVEALQKISEALGVPPGYFFEDQVSETRTKHQSA